MTEADLTPLQTVLDEFKNISPELTKAFIFKKDGEILASNGDSIAEDQAKKLADAFDEIANQAEVVGGMEILTIQGVSSQLDITSTNSRYIATVSSRGVDEKMVKALNCVVVPTVIKLLDQVTPSAPDNEPSDEVKSEVEEVKETAQLPEKPPEELSEEPKPAEQSPDAPAESSKQVFPKPPVNQFIVERIGGLLVASDMVRVDADVVAKWSDLYGKREISEVNVETLEGKSVICKFRSMTEADGKAKGIIQIPERILQILRTGRGKIVMVKPVIPGAWEEKN
ncbi:MAG: hypothetical protein ABSF44_07640 [Candidatus Bathyarchaeia archaeon]